MAKKGIGNALFGSVSDRQGVPIIACNIMEAESGTPELHSCGRKVWAVGNRWLNSGNRCRTGPDRSNRTGPDLTGARTPAGLRYFRNILASPLSEPQSTYALIPEAPPDPILFTLCVPLIGVWQLSNPLRTKSAEVNSLTTLLIGIIVPDFQSLTSFFQRF